MKYLVDTTAYSCWKKGHMGSQAIFREAESLWMTAVILGELRYGFLNGDKQRKNESELREFLESPRVKVAPIDEETSHHYAAIRTSLKNAGTPVTPNDLWIAASAMQHGLTVLSADSDFKKIPQILLEFIET